MIQKNLIAAVKAKLQGSPLQSPLQNLPVCHGAARRVLSKAATAGSRALIGNVLCVMLNMFPILNESQVLMRVSSCSKNIKSWIDVKKKVFHEASLKSIDPWVNVFAGFGISITKLRFHFFTTWRNTFRVWNSWFGIAFDLCLKLVREVRPVFCKWNHYL